MLCATIACGLGVDKPNVRVVMVDGIRNLYEQLQISGRAGRDGGRARVVWSVWSLAHWPRAPSRLLDAAAAGGGGG